jgi:hypothetical protein
MVLLLLMVPGCAVILSRWARTRALPAPWVARLPMVATLACIAGLTATIVALVGTFKSLGTVPADQKQALLSRGIDDAMRFTTWACVAGIVVLACCAAWFALVPARSK